MRIHYLRLWVMPVVLLCSTGLAGNTGAGGAMGIRAPAGVEVVTLASYQLQLLPGQVYQGFYFYWSNGGVLSGNLAPSPAVPWLTLDSAMFTSSACTDIKSVRYNFMAPQVEGTYTATIKDANGHWDSSTVILNVTSAPTLFKDSVVVSLSPGMTTTRYDTLEWTGWSGLGCDSLFIPVNAPHVHYATMPNAPWLSIQPSDFAAALNIRTIVQRTATAPLVGSVSTYEVFTFESGSYPRFVQWKIAATTGIHEQRAGEPPLSYALMQNYPNPFNPTTTIRYGLPRRSSVTLTVFNTLGQKVATLVNETEDAGYYDVRFDGSGLASGVYFYRIQAGDFVQAKKVLIIR